MEKYQLKHYENQSVAQDSSLLQKDDAITFSVLVTILQGTCTHIYTNHESIIICYSMPPYPVWVWCKDVNNREDVQKIAECLKNEFPLEAGYTYNIGYDLLNAIKEADTYFSKAEISTNLLSYRLDTIREIAYPCEGKRSMIGEPDKELAIKLWHDLSLEMLGHEHSVEFCRKKIEHHIEKQTLHCWRNESGEIVALTDRGDTGLYGKIGAVYTLPKHRRKGYAINLVHAVSGDILKDGLVPILYTDADYGASNSCYKKIGFEQVGSLCTVQGKDLENHGA